MGDDDGAISVQKDWRNSGVEIANCWARTPSEAQPWSPILDVTNDLRRQALLG
jgi:hypothetical protein